MLNNGNRPKLTFNIANVSNSSSLPSSGESGQHDSNFDSLALVSDETLSSPPVTSRRVKAVRMNVHTINNLLNDSLEFETLPLWLKVNRIIFQAMGISDTGELDMYPKTSTLQNPLTYLSILRNLKVRYGIQIYVGMPIIYATENNNNNHQNSVHSMIENEPEKFWHSLTFLVHKHGFDGVELNLEGFQYIPHRLVEDLQSFMYRGNLILSVKNNYSFIHHHGKMLKSISTHIESLILNSYGYFKYIPHYNNLSTMLPKCECSVEDFLDSYFALRDYDISTDKILMAVETSAVLYFLDSQNFSEVDCLSFTPLKVVEQLRHIENTTFDYIQHLDREKNGCILECKERGVIISYDNLRMKTLRFQVCRDKLLRGCIVGNPTDDVNMYREDNTINLMNKYI